MTTTDKVIDLAARRAPRAPEGRPLLQRIERPLPPGKPAEQINAILERPDYEGFIQSLTPTTLYRLIKEAGWNEGHDLVQYATPTQIQGFVDLDCWQRDQIVPKKLEPWLAALVADSSDAHFKRVCRDLDPEILAIYFKANIKAMPRDEDGEIPEEMQHEKNLGFSPDNVYCIAYPEDEDSAALVRAFIDRLYAVNDLGLAWTLFEATQWELMSEMEESAYRWRMSRMEEQGFVRIEEALEAYAELDPVAFRERLDRAEIAPKVRLHTPPVLDLPAVVTSQLDEEEYYFFHVLGTVEDDARVHELLFELGVLTNKTLVADGVEPGELDTGHEAARRTMGYLSLGLDFLARSDDARAAEVLEAVALVKIFQTGYSLARKLQRNVLELERRPTLSLVAGDRFSLLGEDDEALCDALTFPRPTFAEDAVTYDIFRDQDQLDAAALRIGTIAFKQLWLFGVQRQSVEALADLVYGGGLLNEPIDVTFDALFATAVATHLATGDAALRGLTLEELQRLTARLEDRPWGDDPIGFFEPVIGPILAELPAGIATMASRWLDETLARLTDELAHVSFVAAPELFRTVFLIAADA